MSNNNIPPVACDTCGDRADTVHFLPWVTDVARVSFCCPDHDDDGYWAELEWLWGERQFAAHLAEKSYRALALLCLRLEQASLAQERDIERCEREFYGENLLRAIPLNELTEIHELAEAKVEEQFARARERKDREVGVAA
ncbi:hypothetical protein BH18ACT14_BH18ACT14_14260 [soil metagenome]